MDNKVADTEPEIHPNLIFAVYPTVVQNQYWVFNSQIIATLFDFGAALLKIFGFYGFIINFIKKSCFQNS